MGLQYIQQLRLYERYTGNAGFSKTHGLRHNYAQKRYLALTGWEQLARGGLNNIQLTPERKALDQYVRLIIPRELGHDREQIKAVYLGSDDDRNPTRAD